MLTGLMSGMNIMMTRFIFFGFLLVLAACSSTVRAPVSTRTDEQNTSQALSQALAAAYPSASQTSARHRVATGDTLYSIAWRYGLDYRDIARWNGIGEPYIIYPGQALRLRAPAATKISPALSAKQQRGVTVPTKPKANRQNKNKTRSTASNKTAPPAAIKWSWPAQGKLVRSNSPIAKKGIDIGGRLGQKINAAAAGEVVYSGSGLLGYGKLIIVKHNDVFLSAYAHNSKLLVIDGERVKQGQQIALMGRGNNGQAALHFEIRKNGKPVNPVAHLPQRES